MPGDLVPSTSQHRSHCPQCSHWQQTHSGTSKSHSFCYVNFQMLQLGANSVTLNMPQWIRHLIQYNKVFFCQTNALSLPWSSLCFLSVRRCSHTTVIGHGDSNWACTDPYFLCRFPWKKERFIENRHFVCICSVLHEHCLLSKGVQTLLNKRTGSTVS